MMHTEAAREQMIEQQVRAWEVLDERVLAVLRAVPREHFVPPEQRFLAFADMAIPLAHGQHMLRPSVVGRLLQALALAGTERVLEVGSGTGFVTACLAASSRAVRSVEIFADLAALAQTNLTALGVDNAQVVNEDALLLASDIRYEAIALTGSLPVYDERWQRQLEIGGRLFVIVGEEPIMEARRVRRLSEETWTSESLFETSVDPLRNARRPEEFSF
ncbi:MAG TPA: protein-L-isoaspartate O-methyltransferase [Steroidobacteraceae bacterium]|nr:protein-L-isoaspartate O-methyltransferase [Steroidobacteraceae bacterium]